MAWETGELEGGPADGARVRVAGRPRVLQVTAPCPVENGAPGLSVGAVYVYRLKPGRTPLRYGWDCASP